MKKNLYFRDALQRENGFKKIIFNIFTVLASPSRIFLEVFVRENFGKRYFSRSGVLVIAFVMALLPVFIYQARYIAFAASGLEIDATFMWAHFATWYALIVAFLAISWKRYQEIENSPSVFDFGKFSLYSGDIHPLFTSIPARLGLDVSMRTIEIIYEPLFFFLIGLLLNLCGQYIGGYIQGCSLCYALSYAAQYWNSDNFIMDKIDEIIMNEELESAFVDEAGPEDCRGVRFHMEKPRDRSLRRKLAQSFIENDDKNDPISCA